jgi:predicted esterase
MNQPTPGTFDPHAATEVYASGAPLDSAHGVVILLHGRGASAADILSVSRALDDGTRNLAFLAPEAAGSTWYPNSFLAPRSSNEPWVSSALRKIQSVVDLAASHGISTDRIVVAGFSQGACLATEFVATHPTRYAGLIAWTGGLIGEQPGGLIGATDSDLAHTGDLSGTPTLQTSGDPDPHVPWSRVEESARVLAAMNARVTTKRYPGKPHSVSPDEVELARTLLQQAFPSGGSLL